MDYRAQFGQILKQLRQNRGWTQEELAHRAGLHVTYVSRLERGLWNPSLAAIIDIGQALDVHPAELLRDLIIEKGRTTKRRRSADTL